MGYHVNIQMAMIEQSPIQGHVGIKVWHKLLYS